MISHNNLRHIFTVGLAASFVHLGMSSRDDWNKGDYTWLIVCAGMCAFYAAFGIGANDVANAYATSVGSKALTVKQAVACAAVFEFAGAILMGNNVAKTIRKGIADVDCYEDNPGLLIYGMTCVLFSVGGWLLLASFLEMPVSTTHSTIGGIIGMTLMSRGRRCVIWNYTKKDYGNGNVNMGFDDFPWTDGVAEIAISWVLSPVASGFIAAILYAITKYGVLKAKNSYFRAKVLFPFIVAFTVGVNVSFWIIKGTSGRTERFGTTGMVREAKDGNLTPAVTVASIAAAVAFGITLLLVIPLSKHIDKEHENKSVEMVDVEENKDVEPVKEESNALYKVKSYVENQLNEDPLNTLKKDELVKSIHSNMETYDSRTEGFFRYVQVFSAMVDSFSHGANDVANAMGPFAAAYFAWNRGVVKSSIEGGDTMTWILGIGGFGIVVGLAVYGYRIMNAMGVKLVAITPSRGYCIELGAAFVIIYGTSKGWPLSTTHCQVGATVAVGLFEGTKGVNKKLLLKTCFGWVITLVVVGLTTALLVGPSPEPLKDLYCPN